MRLQKCVERGHDLYACNCDPKEGRAEADCFGHAGNEDIQSFVISKLGERWTAKGVEAGGNYEGP